MKIALFANALKPQAKEVLLDLNRYLTSHGIEVIISMTDDELLEQARIDQINSADFLISIGGDGSILHLVHKIGIPTPPLIGVNLGSLGFLADIHVNNLLGSIEAVCHGAYQISERLTLDGVLNGKPCGFAINEVATHRAGYPNIIDIMIHVDGLYVNSFSADGIIIATPSGSTAYSLSAGGPILTPDIPAVILTPICPHTISNRPIVLMPTHSISMKLYREGHHADISFDGQPPLHMAPGDVLEIFKSPKMFKLATLHTTDFFSTLRTKLFWSGSLRT